LIFQSWTLLERIKNIYSVFLLFLSWIDLLLSMSDSNAILTNEEMEQILEAAQDTLCYALARSNSIALVDDPTNGVQQSIERALRCVESASCEKRSMMSIKGYAANALARLRTALQALHEMDYVDEGVRLTIRATARALSLIYPFTQTEGPLHLVPLKRAGSRRRSKRERRPRPIFHVTIGRKTNFFTGFKGDITSGGLFIATYNIYPVGTKLTISAEFGQERVIMGSAKVAWVREHNARTPEIYPGMGIVFHNLTKVAEREINQYLAEHESIFYDAG
jgi:uncharacterized protein (TIGR02266 family)